MKLQIDKIETKGGTQTRKKLSQDTVAIYAEAMEDGDEFPPVIVFHDGTTYWLADGFHRVMAAARLQMRDIAATILKGSRLDALKHALGANRTNGLHRSNEDKRHCVEMALKEFSGESDHKIAEWCGVSHKTVSAARKDSVGEFPQLTKRVGRDGKSYPATKSTPPKPPKISGGMTFDVEEIEAAVAVMPKPKKNGRPVVSAKDRKDCLTVHAKLCRSLMAIGIYDEFIGPLSQIATRLKEL
jgi:uncharacterized ParB-like nuclease family protein